MYVCKYVFCLNVTSCLKAAFFAVARFVFLIVAALSGLRPSRWRSLRPEFFARITSISCFFANICSRWILKDAGKYYIYHTDYFSNMRAIYRIVKIERSINRSITKSINWSHNQWIIWIDDETNQLNRLHNSSIINNQLHTYILDQSNNQFFINNLLNYNEKSTGQSLKQTLNIPSWLSTPSFLGKVNRYSRNISRTFLHFRWDKRV